VKSGNGSVSARIREVVRTIPPGRVASYGDVAAAAGNPRASRAVVWALRSAPDTDPAGRLPWHRVVNRAGSVSAHEGQELQRVLLEAEGVEFGLAGTIDMERYRWRF